MKNTFDFGACSARWLEEDELCQVDSHPNYRCTTVVDGLGFQPTAVLLFSNTNGFALEWNLGTDESSVVRGPNKATPDLPSLPELPYRAIKFRNRR